MLVVFSIALKVFALSMYSIKAVIKGAFGVYCVPFSRTDFFCSALALAFLLVSRCNLFSFVLRLFPYECDRLSWYPGIALECTII
jgi:hypothetical protein